ncbi:hypothetical protein, partial [Mycolicibacterium austroafricanum]
ILQIAVARLEREHRGVTDAPVSRWLSQFRHDTTSPVHHQLMISNVAVQERPPLAEVRNPLTTAPAGGTWPLVHQQP